MDALEAPIVLREPGGRVHHANPAALRELGPLTGTVLTRIRRARSAHESSLYLLCGEGCARRRVRARAETVPGPDGRPMELLLVAPDDHLDPAASPIRLRDAVAAWRWPDAGGRLLTLDHQYHSLARRARELRRCAEHLPARGHGGHASPDLAGLTWTPSRDLLAAVLRRVRRHRRGVPIDVHHALARDDRRARASEIGVTRIVLSALEVLGLSDAHATLSARHVGCRLRVRIGAVREQDGDPRPEHASPPRPRPDLRRNQALLRELRPLLRALGATLELIQDRVGDARVHVTIPTAVPPEATPHEPPD